MDSKGLHWEAGTEVKPYFTAANELSCATTLAEFTLPPHKHSALHTRHSNLSWKSLKTFGNLIGDF